MEIKMEELLLFLIFILAIITLKKKNIEGNTDNVKVCSEHDINNKKNCCYDLKDSHNFVDLDKCNEDGVPIQNFCKSKEDDCCYNLIDISTRYFHEGDIDREVLNNFKKYRNQYRLCNRGWPTPNDQREQLYNKLNAAANVDENFCQEILRDEKKIGDDLRTVTLDCVFKYMSKD